MSPPTDSSRSETELGPLREAFQALSHAPEPEKCPSPEMLFDAVHGALETEDTYRLIEHTAACPSCAEEWRLARELEDPSELEGRAPSQAPASRAASGDRGQVIQASHRFRRLAAPILGLAAAAMLVFVVGLPRKDPAPPVEYRAGESQEIESLIASGEALPRDRFRLRWSEVEGATYSILISGADLQVIDQPTDLEEASYLVPAPALEEIEGEVYWQVEALLADGSTRSSKTFVQKIAADP